MNEPFEQLIIRAADQRQMPWKNGLGVTTEIMVSPPDAGITHFDWRVSTATVNSDGAFSHFNGIDRTLTVLSGDGLNLIVNAAAPVALTQSSPPYSFPADAPTYAALIGRPVIDLNVMTRRHIWDHKVTRWNTRTFPDQWQANSEISMWLCTSGEVTFNSSNRSKFILHKGDAVCFESPQLCTFCVVATLPAELILIELQRVSSSKVSCTT